MKNSLKAFESYLRMTALDYKNSVRGTAQIAMELTLEYFESYDHLHNSDSYYLFCQLYFKPAYRNATELYKSMNLSVSIATLCRYRKKFVQAFIYYCNRLDPSFFEDLIRSKGSA